MTLASSEHPTSIGGRWTRMPDAISPMLARGAPEPFNSPDHIFELMWGGVRALAYVGDGRMVLRSRSGRDLSPQFPELAGLTSCLAAREAILDGEIIVINGEGEPDFDAMRPRLHAMSASTRDGSVLPREFLKTPKVKGQVCYQAFDILWLDGRPLLDRALWQRKNRLHETIRAAPELAAVDFVDNEGLPFFDAVIERKLEGIVAKQKVSVYEPGVRSRSWLEVRALQSGDFVIGGYTFGGTRRKGDAFGQLLLGAYEGGQLHYAGSVSGGLRDTEARDLVELLETSVIETPPFAHAPAIPRLIYWTEPRLVCRVRFSEWSRNGLLRFPIFSSLRPDLKAEECLLR